MHTRRIGDRRTSARSASAACRCRSRAGPDESRSLATIHAALDAGVTLIDTADAYHLHADEVGHNESLIAKALASHDRGGRRPGRHQGRPPAPRRRQLDAGRQPRAPQGGLRGVADAGSASRRSASTSSTAPTRGSPTRSPSARCATCSTRARSAPPASPTPTPTRSGRRNEILGGRLVSVQNQFSPAFRSSEPELRPVRRARHRVPAVEPARRHLPRPRTGLRATRRSRRSPRRTG